MGTVDQWTTYEHLKQKVLGWHRNGRADLTGVRQWRADLSNGCPQPFSFHRFARTALSRANAERRLSVEVVVACKKRDCERCQQIRANTWMARAGAEYRKNARTWMVTLTASPQNHAELALRGDAQKAFMREANRFYRSLLGHSNARTQSSYLLVCELHNSARTSPNMRGRPHAHMLLHEKAVGALISDDECEFAMEADCDGSPRTVYRVKDDSLVRQKWRWGFSKVILCYNEHGAVYVCKYLTGEETHGRARASAHYGLTCPDDGGTLSGPVVPGPLAPGRAPGKSVGVGPGTHIAEQMRNGPRDPFVHCADTSSSASPLAIKGIYRTGPTGPAN